MTEHPSVHQSNYCYFICTYHNRYDGWCHYHSKDASEVDLTKCPKVLEMSKQSKSADEITIDLKQPLKESNIFKVKKTSQALQLENVHEHYGFGFSFEWENEVNAFCDDLNNSFSRMMTKIIEQDKKIQKQDLMIEVLESDNQRYHNRDKRIRRDLSRLMQHVRDMGYMTDDEILKVLEG